MTASATLSSRVGHGFAALALVSILLSVSGCANIPATGRTVQNVDIQSVEDLPPAVQRMHQVVKLGSIQGTKISRKGNHVTSQSLNYVVGMVPSIPNGIKLGTLTAQAAPNLYIEIFNNGSNCTSLPATVQTSLSKALAGTLAQAGNPMPPGKIEVHLVAPVTGMYSLTTNKSREPRIFLTFYFDCIRSSDPANLQFAMSQAISSVVHELTHAAFQWHGEGDGDQFTADGAAACFIEHLDGLDPRVLKQLPFWWAANTRADQIGASGSHEAKLEDACQHWMQAMQQLQAGG